MSASAFDDFVDDCFLNGDEICSFEICRTRKYENKKNLVASELISKIEASYSYSFE
tara:strand:- start:5403 stop:5570 length:168 start_codon:yes stop_codon:yes gene_type:complete